MSTEPPVPNEITVEWSHNEKKHGIELRFSSKPDEATRLQLRKRGWRWSTPFEVWWHFDTEEARTFAFEICATGCN